MERFPKIPGYRIVAEIGSGSMGRVYKAIQISMEREVALKVLSRELSRDKKFTKRFLAEARAMGSLRHQNLVSALDAGCVDGLYYFVMDYVEGETLDGILTKRGSLSPQEAFAIGAQIAAGLEFAHKKGLVHRDVKPGNIIVDADGVAKLCDMGLTRPKGTFASFGRMEGTPNYISPEQASGSGVVDHRSDIYSLGATLYRMVTGKAPFEGGTAEEIAYKHIHSNPRSVREVVPDVPKEYAAVIEKMMAKRPQDRYQSMADARRDMEAVLRGDVPSVLKRPLFVEFLTNRKFVAAVGGAVFALILLLLLLPNGGEQTVATGNREERRPYLPWQKGSGHTQKQNEQNQKQTSSQPGQMQSEQSKQQKERELLAKVEKEVRQLAERFAEPENLEELKVKMEALAAQYAGTVAERYIKEQIKRVEKAIERRDALRALRNTLNQAADLLKQKRYNEAMGTLKRAEPAYGMEKDFEAMRGRIIKENRQECKYLRQRVMELLKDGKVDEAESSIKEFIKRSLPDFVPSAEKLKDRVEKERNAKREKEVLAELWGRFVSLLKDHKYDEARKYLNKAGSLVLSRKGIEQVDRCRGLLEATLSAIRCVREALLGARGQTVEYPLYSGGKVIGKIIGVGADYVIFEINKGARKERIRVSLWEIDFSEFFSVGGGIDGYYWWSAGVYLWHIGHPEQALSFMNRASSLGYRVDKQLVAEVAEAERIWWDKEVNRLIGDIQKLLDAGDAEKAAIVLGKALGDKRLLRVKIWQKTKEELRNAVREALIENHLSKGIERLLRGRIKRGAKDAVIEIEYRFIKEEEYEDFKPIKGAMRRGRGGTFVTGIFLHKVVFTGDVEVEIKAAPQDTRPANIGILLKRGEGGVYLGGLGLKPVSRARMRFKLPYRPPRAPRNIPLPVNMIVHLNRNFGSPEMMAYSLRPSIKRRSYTISFSHKGSILKLSVSGQTICRVSEKFKKDTSGQIGLWSGGGTFRINYMRIKGRPDEGWLRKLASDFVEKKYPFLKKTGKRNGKK